MENTKFSDVRNAQKNSISKQPENQKEKQVSFQDWQKLDLKIGKILKADNIEGADKLYKLEVDLGEDKPKILVAGLKQHYTPEELKNKLCVVFTNLEPAKLKGIESEGMVLAAVSGDETKIYLLQPDQDIEPGTKIR